MTQPAVATVLTVEDDPIVRADLRPVLEDAGFSVCPDARDGVEAVEVAREHNPDEESRRVVDLVRRALGYPDAWAAEFEERALAWGTWRVTQEEGRAPDDRR